MKEGFKRIRKIIAQGIMTKLQRAGEYSRCGLRFSNPLLESKNSHSLPSIASHNKDGDCSTRISSDALITPLMFIKRGAKSKK
jgi:hypothetical protein